MFDLRNDGHNYLLQHTTFGYIRGNVIIKNVDVINSTINCVTKYAGGIVGYISNIVKIEKDERLHLHSETTKFEN